MALERGKLSNVVQVAAGTTVGIITCASSKKVYIKSIICHQSGGAISMLQPHKFISALQVLVVHQQIKSLMLM